MKETYKVSYRGNLDVNYKEPPLYHEIEQFVASLKDRKKHKFHFFDIPQEREIELINCLFDCIREKVLIEKYGTKVKDILEYSTIKYEMNGCLCEDITVYGKWGSYLVIRFY